MTEATTYKSEVRDGMRIDWDVPVPMDDGLVLRADVYRPIGPGRYPVLMTYGPYAKWLSWQDGYKTVWELFSKDHPEAISGSTNKYQTWETVDPEHWVPDGYAVVRIDSRGAGRSPGFIDHYSPRETQDYAACIEWAGVQPWSNGKVGLNGISYYGSNQWHVACLQPKHLAAMCIWEGAADMYREFCYHGGIMCTFLPNWFDMQIKTIQHGLGTNGYKSNILAGELVSGPPTLPEATLAKNRQDIEKDILAHPLDDKWHRDRSPDWSKVKTPFLSTASWAGQGLHPRGNYEGYVRAAAEEKWLEIHGLEHWTEFYTPYGRELQKQFFAHYLKGEKNGWNRKPRVMVKTRHVGERFEPRVEKDWPLPQTKWTKLFLDPSHMSLGGKGPAKKTTVTYDGLGDGVTFFLPPADEETEILGPIAAKLFVSSETADADLFLVVRLFTGDMKEVTFQGTVDPHTPIAQGWLRASHRKLDKKLSKPYWPYHPHDEKQPLTPGRVYECDVEIWPTGIVVPRGYRIALSVRGKDYVYPGEGLRLSNMKNELTGCGPFLHDNPKDRPARIFGGRVTLHAGPNHPSYLMLPVIPGKKRGRKR